MRIPAGNVLHSKPSVVTIGWGASVVIHAIGAALGMLYVSLDSLERPELLGHAGCVELVASWAEPEEPAASVEMAPIASPEIRRVEHSPIDAEVRVPVEREHSPIDVEARQPATELVMSEDLTPLPAPVAPRRDIVALQEEPPRATASPRCVPRRMPRASLPDVEVPRSVPRPRLQASVPVAVDQLPRKLQTNPTPPYPPDAFARRQQGRVLLEVHIDQRGLVEHISLSKSSGVPSLDRAALETVRKWRFEPARRGGKPVSFVVIVPVRFVVRGW